MWSSTEMVYSQLDEVIWYRKNLKMTILHNVIWCVASFRKWTASQETTHEQEGLYLLSKLSNCELADVIDFVFHEFVLWE